MFNFFRKKAAPIKAVSIPDLGWEKVRDTSGIIHWVNPEQSISVSVNYFDLPPDLPSAKDLSVIRQFFRSSVAQAGGGIIAVDLSHHQHIPLVSTLFKFPQQPNGITYIASVIIPFKECSYVLKVTAVEAGHTGMREAMVMDMLSKSGFDTDLLSADPYEPGFREGVVMNATEKPEYDTMFPSHHLSQARQLIARITQEMVLQPVIFQLPPFEQ
ncbi:hypothetical protein HHL17_06375 [Chitinophaga sp. G-6-1-13]|uniref:Uncharacterized protein n=1 Tax=Chitinophaga fulva TaxID=2728842 RepID=A0A848GG58_9BACT|nr:hypothetical protein [Chitinophaga fulva]NML36817.1 hypothetical protein [Chitinophaga fulva]